MILATMDGYLTLKNQKNSIVIFDDNQEKKKRERLQKKLTESP